MSKPKFINRTEIQGYKIDIKKIRFEEVTRVLMWADLNRNKFIQIFNLLLKNRLSICTHILLILIGLKNKEMFI